jgi:transcriptional regulator with XRE-family HTH domain
MTKGLPPSTTEIAVRRGKLKQLADNVRSRRSAKGWNQSALAREIWGEYRNPRTGRMSAKNRDRISSIEREKSWPEVQTLAQIASALETTPQKLTGETVVQIAELTMVGAGKRHLKVDMVVPANIGTQVMALLDHVPPAGT